MPHIIYPVLNNIKKTNICSKGVTTLRVSHTNKRDTHIFRISI